MAFRNLNAKVLVSARRRFYNNFFSTFTRMQHPTHSQRTDERTNELVHLKWSAHYSSERKKNSITKTKGRERVRRKKNVSKCIKSIFMFLFLSLSLSCSLALSLYVSASSLVLVHWNGVLLLFFSSMISNKLLMVAALCSAVLLCGWWWLIVSSIIMLLVIQWWKWQ